MTAPVPISEIVAGLAGAADRLAAELLPGGRREGREWRCGSLAGEAGRSFAVCINGPRAGVWSDFATGEAGDALDLVAAALFGGDKAEAVKWSLAWLGLSRADPAAMATRRREIAAQRKRTDAAEAAAAERTRRRAVALWLSAQVSIRATPVDDYLKGRGLDLAALGRAPGVLRYHPDCWNRAADAGLPAMLALIHGANGKPCAVHRTWLDVSGGAVAKAALDDPKMTWGRYRGGCIHLWRGADARPLSRAAAGSAVTIAEGLEDGLTAVLADPSRRVLCAVSLSNLGALDLPDTVTEITLLQQRDPPGSKAAAAFDDAVVRFQRQGRRVLLAPPPDGFKDLNDAICGKATA